MPLPGPFRLSRAAPAGPGDPSLLSRLASAGVPRRREVLFVVLVLFPGLPGALTAQGGEGTAVVEREENFRAEPNGAVIGRLSPGTGLDVVSVEGGWVQADLEGWMWARSLQVLDRSDFDLVISASEGENLRSAPSGDVVARLGSRTFLDELERVPGWIRVSRRGWIWEPSVRLEVEVGGAPEGAGGTPGTAAPGAPASEADAPPPAGEWRRSPPGGTAVLTAPDGDTLAVTAPGSELRVVGREGSWARIRVEGWAWMPPDGGEETGADAAVLRDVTPEAVAREPDRYRGRIVSWELQFISRERAEQVRTDFYEGEPYLLTRVPGGERRFVYVTLPPEQAGDLPPLTPLQRIRVTGRVRTGAAALTGNPILDLLELVRVPARPPGG